MNSTVRVRIDSATKEKAEKVLKDMGLTLSVAIRIYLKQIARTERLNIK